ncbi:MAG TPA: Nramp family divalent metal transporter [Nocardioidaceae bacterium]|nr:Nramp family divalent metal transporter [Nocardioidaceae bacterium]
MTYRDLPDPPRSFWRIVGPGVVLAAGGIGSGEFVLWPYVSQQTGLGFLWAAVLGTILMFFIATECCRYTLATGETIITGFTRLWKPWWIGFVLMALLPNLWPGYATGTATLVTFVTGGGPVILITILFLLAIVLSLTLSPVVYNMMEVVMSIRMGLTLLFLLIAVVVTVNIRGSAWRDFAVGFSEVGTVPQGIPFSVLAGAVAFAGAGGTGVLMASNYVRDKNLGMGAHIPRVISPITGKEEPGSNIGHFFPHNKENMRRWRTWWKAENWDQLITFFGFTIIAIFIMSVLAYATLYGQDDVGEGFSFLRTEGEELGAIVGAWFKILFWLAGALALFATNLAVWDQISRITADAVKANWLRESPFWTESKVYAATLVLLFTFSVLVLASGLQQPLVLLVITSVLSGVTSFIYCALIVQLNRFAMPTQVRMGNARFGVMGFAVLFYGAFFIVTVLGLLGVME